VHLLGATSGNRGECHRYAPRPVPQMPSMSPGAARVVNNAAITTDDYWCGDFK